MQHCEGKFERLIQTLRQYRKLAIAFSGGVDSTLLLHAALTALGTENVIALCARSILNSAASVAESRAVYLKNFPQATTLREVAIDPLSWQDFVINDQNRCYYCKKKMYMALRKGMAAADCAVLADGTNSDDLLDRRPGLRAISELQVITPLAEVGLIKAEIRWLAKKFCLSNYNLPSNSCLATRIPENILITENTLRIVESAEQYLHGLGFLGCRVRVQLSCTLVEIQEKDIQAFVEPQNRAKVQSYFFAIQRAPVVLNLKGR